MLGKYLRKWRLENNLTQKKAAELIGTSQSYYCLIEVGARKPGMSLIGKIANALSVNPSFLRSLL